MTPAEYAHDVVTRCREMVAAHAPSTLMTPDFLIAMVVEVAAVESDASPLRMFKAGDLVRQAVGTGAGFLDRDTILFSLDRVLAPGGVL